MLLHGEVIEEYRDFATYASGDSPCFEAWALGVAEDTEVLAWLGTLPPIKRQPNLVFAAARWHGAPAPASYDDLRRVLLGREADVRSTVMARATQTNEVGRLATLTPVLALVDRPLALIEVGASAGLCLFPDRYDYSWPPAGELRGSGGPVLTATTTGPLPVPSRHPEVAWRGGVDLNPLDVADADAMAWLENLVWPEQQQRRARLAAAVTVARQDPPRLVTGDLLTTLPSVLEEVPEELTAVVFHSAVAAYLEPSDRTRFTALMTGLVGEGRCTWVSNEAPEVLPEVAASGPAVPPGMPTFVLGVDGRARAWTHGHGSSMTWLAG